MRVLISAGGRTLRMSEDILTGGSPERLPARPGSDVSLVRGVGRVFFCEITGGAKVKGTLHLLALKRCGTEKTEFSLIRPGSRCGASSFQMELSHS